jgi:hypothetical protein
MASVCDRSALSPPAARHSSPPSSSIRRRSFAGVEIPHKRTCAGIPVSQFCTRGVSFTTRRWKCVPCPILKESSASRPCSIAPAFPAPPSIARSPREAFPVRYRSASMAQVGTSPPSAAGSPIPGAIGSMKRDGRRLGYFPVFTFPNLPLSTLAPSRRKSRWSDQCCIIRTRSSQYSPRV